LKSGNPGTLLSQRDDHNENFSDSIGF